MRPSKYREDLAEDLATSRFLSSYFTLHCHSVHRKAELTDLQITSRVTIFHSFSTRIFISLELRFSIILRSGSFGFFGQCKCPKQNCICPTRRFDKCQKNVLFFIFPNSSGLDPVSCQLRREICIKHFSKISRKSNRNEKSRIKNPIQGHFRRFASSSIKFSIINHDEARTMKVVDKVKGRRFRKHERRLYLQGVEQLVVRLATRRTLQRLMKSRRPNDAKKSQLFSSSSLKLLTIRSPGPQHRQSFHDR